MEINGIRNDCSSDHYIMGKVVYQEMIEYCRNHLPYEACGLLSGVTGKGLTLWKLKNESRRLNRFYMSRKSIKQAVEEMEEHEELPTGIFHSHPNTPATPSFQDIKNNPYTKLAYIIVSFYKGKVEVGCFKTNGKSAVPLELIIFDE
jgi:[CysO sulfur-carrier protein]-S-L-cysteine hydrolase